MGRLPSGTVSFLFTDVVRSTALLTSLDQERYAALLDAQRRCIEEAVAAAGGAIVDRAGDGLLAAFESAKAALSAAVAAQRSLAGAPEGERAEVRMGIDSGDVLLRDGGYVGAAVHGGARICTLAGGGCVLLSATSRELVGAELPEGVEVRDLGAVALAGFREPMHVFQAVVEDLPASTARPQLPRGQAVPLLDREAELALLDERVRGAARGEGGVVVVEGPAGIGKTTLLQAARSAAIGMRALEARATELETGYPFGVVRHLLEQPVREARASVLSGAAAAAAPIFDAGSEESVGDGFAVLHALYWLTANLAELRPVLLCVDDVQWCDAPSLRYLAYLAPRLGGLPIALLVARRSGEPSVAEDALQVVTADPSAALVRPGGLSEPAVAELLRRTFDETPDPAFVVGCREATGSNPLLVRELAGALAGAGISPTADAVGSIPEVGPGAVSRFVLRRLVRLSPPAQTLVESVAVLGDGCALASAAGHAGLDQAIAADAAGSLALAELLAEGTPLRFVHPLVRDAVYRKLSPGERAAAHARAAEILAGEGDSIRVGLHLLEAPPALPERAVAALREAALAAERDGAAETTAAFLGRILDAPLDAEQRADTLLALGSAELRFDHERAAVHLREALAAGRDGEAKGEASLLLGRALYAGGRHAEAIAVLDSARVALADPNGDLAYRIDAELVGPISEHREEARVIALLEDVARRDLSGDGLGERMLAAQLAASLALPLPREEYVRLARSVLKDDLLLGDDTSDIFVWATAGLSAADELVEARAALDRAVEHGRRRGSLLLLATGLQFRARVVHVLGDLSEAEGDARACQAALELHPLPTVQRYLAATLAEILVSFGRLDEAAATLAALPPLADAPEAPTVLYARGEVALATGRIEEALRLMDEIEGPPVPEHLVWPQAGQRRWRLLRVEALVSLGRTEEAAAVIEPELARARTWGAPRQLARTLRLAALTAPADSALELLLEARELIEDSPARLDRARVLGALGAALRRVGHRNEARDVLREGLELAHLCGAAVRAREIQDELVVAGGRPRRVRLSGVESLTPSELRIARLAADGRANREIAQELFVTLKTVEMHLASSYRKLGISSRSQLPTLLAAQEQG